SFIDMLDGRIARKYGLVTDLGKFLDLLADKFMVIGTMMAIVYRNDAIRPWFFWLVLCVIFREFAVTSLRLVISASSGEVVAAAMPGKIKTVLQMFTVLSALLEPVFAGLSGAGEVYFRILPVTLCLSVLAFIFTLWSGIDYFVSYAKKRKETSK
ncbi:MAG: CDP-alcohol phosphatidyltransferase family protein, partial [Clostridia bacterium]|nr:CDP-alcohol phosphatidyltransferase family protein [Clostridia bacterium]